MKKILFTFIIIITTIIHSYGQINPIENLTWSAWYDFPNNYFILEWEEPVEPHDDLIGYNVYREDELYRFQEETSLYNLVESSNCEEDFLFYDDGSPFYVHVTAVYNPEGIESTYTQTVYVEGYALSIIDTNQNTPVLFPNPTTGILNIGNENIDKIILLDITGKIISELDSKPQIDLSNYSKGIYFVQLISEKRIATGKIVIE